MKLLLLSILMLVVGSPASLYDFKMNSLEGKMIDFSQYKGKTLLIVNVASKCGNTPQYADLQKLHETYGSKVTILGFPANNFGGQEPGLGHGDRIENRDKAVVDRPKRPWEVAGKQAAVAAKKGRA